MGRILVHQLQHLPLRAAKAFDCFYERLSKLRVRAVVLGKESLDWMKQCLCVIVRARMLVSHLAPPLFLRDLISDKHISRSNRGPRRGTEQSPQAHDSSSSPSTTSSVRHASSSASKISTQWSRSAVEPSLSASRSLTR